MSSDTESSDTPESGMPESDFSQSDSAQSSGARSRSQEQELQEQSLLRDADFSQDATASGESSRESSSGSDLQTIKRENQRLQEELVQQRESYLRAIADLENYKKRALKERSDLLRYQGERILFDLLSVLDAMELASQHRDSDPAQLKAGVELTYKLFVDTLGKWEVRAVEGIGQPFDPNRFQAIGKAPVSDAAPGTIIQVARKAYFYRDKLLRPGEVVVAVAAESNEQILDTKAEG
jgi:molecular chaperone GrpE